MGKVDYHRTWRGARRYRFDIETRLKRAERQRSARLFPSIRRALMGLPAIPIAFLLVGAAGAGFTFSDLSVSRLTAMLPGSGCNIKGNISINTGERIYHVPGQKYYDNTIISPRYGERWFCSEADARRAGWRKSHQ